MIFKYLFIKKILHVSVRLNAIVCRENVKMILNPPDNFE